jgi:hypothetical protein
MSKRTPAAEIAVDQHDANQEQRNPPTQKSQPPRWAHQTSSANGPALGHCGEPCHAHVCGRPTNHRKGRPHTVFGSIATAPRDLSGAATQLNTATTSDHRGLLNVGPRQHRTRGKRHKHEQHAEYEYPSGGCIRATDGFVLVGHAQVLPNSSIGSDDPTTKVLLGTHILWGDSMPRRSKPSERTLRTKSHNRSREACTTGSSAFKTEHCW